MKYLLIQFPDTEDMSVYAKGANVIVDIDSAGTGTVFATIDAVTPLAPTLVAHTHDIVGSGSAQITGESGLPIT